MDGVREVAIDPVSVSHDKLVFVGLNLRRAIDEKTGEEYDRITAFWEIPEPGGGMHRISADLTRALSDQLDTSGGGAIVDAIRDASLPRAQEVFDQFWGPTPEPEPEPEPE